MSLSQHALTRSQADSFYRSTVYHISIEHIDTYGQSDLHVEFWVNLQVEIETTCRKDWESNPHLTAGAVK